MPGSSVECAVSLLAYILRIRQDVLRGAAAVCIYVVFRVAIVAAEVLFVFIPLVGIVDAACPYSGQSLAGISAVPSAAELIAAAAEGIHHAALLIILPTDP